MSDIFDYLDYRKFLRDQIENLRKDGRFSYRQFNRKAGFKSSSTLKLVIDGKRNLAQDGIYKVAKGLKLSGVELKFFNTLVLMNQSASHDQKDHHFRELSQFRPFRKARELTALQYDCLSHWYYAAIMELVRLKDFDGTAEWIAKKLSPSLSLTEIRRALLDLEQLKILARDENGTIIRNSSTFTTPDEVTSLSLINFHQQMCDLAKKAVTEVPSLKREFSSLTIAVSKDGFQKIKSRVQQFKRELDSYLEEETVPRAEVVQINFHIFPLTKEES
ncbi:MAG: TIGR02147 family protein [Deltaproteobacteria bacterium]|nr:TIGR02147 family protein [Deltaproteobacteria bacterium]